MPQEKNYFVVTGAGLNLLANLQAGTRLEITRVVVGAGEIPDGVDPRTLNNLITPIAQATSTVPIVTDNRLNFDVEYRNDFGKFDAPLYWTADGCLDAAVAKLANVPEIFYGETEPEGWSDGDIWYEDIAEVGTE
jgi:hypothetical protein